MYLKVCIYNLPDFLVDFNENVIVFLKKITFPSLFWVYSFEGRYLYEGEYLKVCSFEGKFRLKVCSFESMYYLK